MTAQDWRVGRLVECCLKQKGAYYPHLALFTFLSLDMNIYLIVRNVSLLALVP